MKEARTEYKKSRKNTKRIIFSAKEKKQKEWANDFQMSVKMKFFEWQSR